MERNNTTQTNGHETINETTSNEMTTTEGDHLATYIWRDLDKHYEAVEQLSINGEESFMAYSHIEQVKVLEVMVSKLKTTARMGERIAAMIEAIYRRASFSLPEKFSS